MEEKKNVEFESDKNVLLFIFVDDVQLIIKFVVTVADALNEVAKFKQLFNPCGYVTYSIFEKVCEGEQI